MQVGGGNLYKNVAALRFLASRCDELVFVGMMSFQIMHALGLSVPSSLVEKNSQEAALELIQFAYNKNTTISFPKDIWCIKNQLPKQSEIFPAHVIPDGK